MSSTSIQSPKRKRSSHSLPALTIVTRSSLRKQSNESGPKSGTQKASGIQRKTVRIQDEDAIEESEDEDEVKQEGASFKKMRIQAPLYISEDSLDMAAPAPIYNTHHEDEEYDDFEEEMPKFQYESKFNGKHSNVHTPALYTPEERQLFSDMLFSQFVDFDEPSSNPMDFEQPEPVLDFISDDDLDTDLPLVTPLELSETKPNSSKLPILAASRSGNDPAARWPISQQDNSTSFSTLGQASIKREQDIIKREETSSSKNVPSLSSETDSVAETESLDDFFMYDNASSSGEVEEESNGAMQASPAIEGSASPTVKSSTSTPVEPFRNIPLCGYRDRNQTFNIPSGSRPLNPKRIMAALASLAPRDSKSLILNEPSTSLSATLSGSCSSTTLSATALYPQALVAATGFNCRSLFSGKASEMIAVGDFWA